MNRIEKYWVLCLLLVLWGYELHAQEDCKDGINYSISNVTINGGQTGYYITDDQSMQITVGQTYVGKAGSRKQGITGRAGMWGFYELEPQAPIAKASQGEYIDRIEVEWVVVDDYVGPVVTEEITKVYRNGKLLTTVPVKQTSYVDYNVFPGEFYTYEIVTTNSLGDAKPIEVVGFLNPNGRVTGKVETRSGAPVSDVKVVLSPNLGRSLDFDGVDDYVYFLDQAYSLSEYYTIEGWWRNVENKEQTLFVAVDSGTTNTVVKISLDADGKIHYFHDGNVDGTGIELVSRDGYNLDNFSRDWHHFAAVYDTANVYLYVDGARVAEAAPEVPISTTLELEIGKDGPKQYTGYYVGHLDELRVWGVGRERAEIRKYKDITLTGEEDFLTNYWKFDEQYSDKIFDYAEKPVEERENGFICGITRSDFISPAELGAYTDDGGDYLIKGVYYGSGQTFTVTPSKETPIGYSLDFDGTDDFVSFNLDRLDWENEFTIEGWVKTDVDGKDMVIYEVTNSAADQTYLQMGIQADGKFYANVGFSGSAQTLNSTDAVNDEFWYHYSLVHDGTTAELYIDGVSQGSIGDAFTEVLDTRYVIGRSGPVDYQAGDMYLDGLLDEIRVWNYAKTFNQVNATLNQIIPGDEQGIVDPDGDLGLTAYWMLGEGQGTIISDASPNGHSGNLLNPQEIEIENDEFLVTNWEGDDIPLDVEYFIHDYDPNGRNVSLDPSNVSVDRVDFTDISQIGISGFVRYSNSDCFAEGVEIRANGSSLAPPVKTDENGKFIAEFEPGATSIFLTLYKDGQEFTPGYIELPRLVRPIAGLSYEATTTYQLDGVVAGGECGLPIGDAEVRVVSEDGCFEATTSVDPSTAKFEFAELPPLKYIVSVDHVDPVVQSFFDVQGALEGDLSEGDDSLNFIYRAPVEVAAYIENPEPNDCGIETLQMGKTYTVAIELFETYNGETCLIESGMATINDQISENGGTSEIDVINGIGSYDFVAGVPSQASPYTKALTVVAESAIGDQTSIFLEPVVLGFNTLNNTFRTTSPEFPMFILRDPYGDGSYSYFEQNTTTCATWGFSQYYAASGSFETNIEMGADIKFSTGLGFQKTTEIDLTNSLTIGFEYDTETSAAKEGEVCLSNSEILSTSDDQYFIGEEGDVFIGGAFNVLTGINRTLTLNKETCELELEDKIMISPEEFATTYVYAQSYIEGTLIPNLENDGLIETANHWRKILASNEEQKLAASFKENVSFSAGLNLERSTSSEQTSSYTYELTESFASSISNELGVEVDGVGVTVGTAAAGGAGSSNSEGGSSTDAKTIGYVLSDDDPGDSYTMDIKTDAIGMPVFSLVSGETSCPYVEGTRARTKVSMTPLSPSIVTEVSEYEAATFRIAISNISETNEIGFYNVNIGNESNPDGAIVRINGNFDQTLQIPAGESLELVITIEKQPSVDVYRYEDIEIILSTPCEDEYWEPLGIATPEPQAAYYYVTAEFVEVCSEVAIFEPQDNWLINSESNNQMTVTLNSFDTTQTELSELKFQYRKQVEGEPFVNATTFGVDTIDQNYITFNWDVADLSDGIYEIRAVSECTAGLDPGVSDLVVGRIDRKAPSVFGTPSPVDAVLGLDDEISITFDEEINCDEIISLGASVSLEEGSVNNVNLSNTELGISLEKNISCIGNELIITPDIQNKFIEGKVLRVDLLGIEDLYGNVQTEPITWEFNVERNPLVWQGGDIQSVSYEGESPQFVRQVKNNGAFAINVNLSGELDVQTLDETSLPSWLSASPRSFTLQPGATQDVTFTVSNQISGGSYVDMVTAATSFGAPELRFDVRVLCEDPTWNVNASDFEYSTTLTGQLDIRGELSTDVYDIVAAYVGDELRGVGQVVYAPELEAIPDEHPYMVFMTIYSNSTNTEEIDFQVWDASRCQLYGQVAENYEIGATSISIGSPTSPATITVTNNVVQKMSLNKGWNWISFNLDMESTAINDVLGTLQNADRGAIIKSQAQYSQYVPSLGWVGPLSKIDSTKAYRVKLTADDVLEVKGMPTDFETTFVELDSGWNWVSFLPPVGMEINEALTSLTATADFIIKGQKEFAQYVDFQGWIGSLDFLRPNQGYLIYTDRSQTLEYPVNNENARIEIPEEDEIALPVGWSLNPSIYEFNANYIIRVDGAGIKEGDVIGLFNGETLMGVGDAQFLDFMGAYYFFVTAYSDTPIMELTAKVVRSGSEITFADQPLSYGVDRLIGTVQAPVVLQSGAILGTELPKMTFDLYPNPGELSTTLSLNLVSSDEVEISIQNLMGQTLDVRGLGKLSAGKHEIEINRNVNNTELSSGIYFVRIKVGSEVYTEKLIWK